jgi:hypothetical protein
VQDSSRMIQGNQLRRNFCSQLVSVIRFEGSEPQPAISGNLEEIAASAAVVLTEDFIHPGTKVRIVCNLRELRGVAESFQMNEWLGFFVRVRLDADSRWSRRWFRPEHLLTVACRADGPGAVGAALGKVYTACRKCSGLPRGSTLRADRGPGSGGSRWIDVDRVESKWIAAV